MIDVPQINASLRARIGLADDGDGFLNDCDPVTAPVYGLGDTATAALGLFDAGSRAKSSVVRL